MRHPKPFLFLLALSFALTSCGKAPRTFDVVAPREPVQKLSQPVNVTAAGNGAVSTRRALVAFLAAGTHAEEQPPAIPVELPSVVSPSLQTTVPAAASLPPEWVIQRESGGDYNAYNPSGCYSEGRSGCFGKYQFGWFWAGKLGLPEDLSTATPEQQDEAARQLWNQGAGCSHWAAC